MNTGDIVWQVANGDTYEWIKLTCAQGPDHPENRTRGRGGIVVTKTLAFAGQGCGLFRGGGAAARCSMATTK